MSQYWTRSKAVTPEDYISCVEKWLAYRGQIGLTSWGPIPQDIANLMSISDSGDGELETHYLDLNSCLGNAVRDVERDKYIQNLVLNHRNLIPQATEILNRRIDSEISDLATAGDLKKVDTKLADKIIGLSKNKLFYPGYTVLLLSSRPREVRLASDASGPIRSFRMPLKTSFEDFIAKIYSESLMFWPNGHGINQGYNLENSAWTYNLLNNGLRIYSKDHQITRKPDYLALLQHMRQNPTDKVDASPPPSCGEMAEAVVVSPSIPSGPPLHIEPLPGVTREEHNWLVNTHPVDIVDYVIELKDRGSRAYQSSDPVSGLQEYNRGLAFMSYLTKDPPSMQRLCSQIRATLNLNCALMLLELGRFEEAIACSLKALEVADLTNGQMASAYYRCGAGRAGLEDSLAAFNDLLEAYKFDPHDRQILKMLDIIDKSLPENTDPTIRKNYEAIRAGAPIDFPEGSQDRAYESVLSLCEIQTIDRPKEGSGLPTKESSVPSSRPNASTEKGDLGLPDNFWDDWTSQIDEDGEPLDRHGNPFFEPYDPSGIIRAALKDPSFP